MNLSSCDRRLGIGLLCIYLAAAWWEVSVAVAQEADASVFGESLDLYLVNVEVRVTDRQGRPVTGLPAQHFSLKEDGKKVEITNFSEIPIGDVLRLGPKSSTEPAGEPQPDATVIYLLDESSTSPYDRQAALDQLKQLLTDGLGGNVQTALAIYDDTLQVLVQPTTDRQALIQAIDGLSRPKASGVLRSREGDRFLADIASRAGEIRNEARADLIPPEEAVRKLNQLNKEAQLEADRRRGENRDRYAAFGALVDALVSYPGRKAVVLLTEGIPLRPGQAALDIIQDALWEVSSLRGAGSSGSSIDARSAALGAIADQSAPPPRRRSKRKARPDDLFTLAALAANARVGFYPWKARQTQGGADAGLGGQGALELSPSILSERNKGLVETLRILAAETGGDARIGGGLEGLVEDALADFGGYYSLAFSPAHGGDDRLHKLKLKVKGRGLEVWYPKSYIARSIHPAQSATP